MYAQVLVEIDINKGFHDSVAFTNEDNELINVKVAYDWRPTLCTKCKQLRHTVDKLYGWSCKEVGPKPAPVQTTSDNEGFQLVRSKRKGKSPIMEDENLSARLLSTSCNGFEVLTVQETVTLENDAQHDSIGGLPHPVT